MLRVIIMHTCVLALFDNNSDDKTLAEIVANHSNYKQEY